MAIPQPPLPEPNPLTPFQPAGGILAAPALSGAQPDWNGLLGPPTVTPTPGGAAAAIQPVAPAYDLNRWPWGMSSITRNRLANRVLVAPAAAADGSVPSGAAPRSANPQRWAANSIARNRLGRGFAREDEPQYDYPKIHEDPAKRYHDLYGVEEDHDRFWFPWLMNLIFEDRWLLDEHDTKVALQNQLRRRMRVDIRDPDPDTANFPNGAYTLPKGRIYIETSPASFYGGSKVNPPQYNWEYLFRYGLTDNLLAISGRCSIR